MENTRRCRCTAPGVPIAHGQSAFAFADFILVQDFAKPESVRFSHTLLKIPLLATAWCPAVLPPTASARTS